MVDILGRPTPRRRMLGGRVPGRRMLGRRGGSAAVLVAIAACALTGCGGAGTRAPSATTSSGPGVYRWGVVGNKGKIAQLEVATPVAVAGITGKVVQIATSNSDGYALTATGQVFGWGVNTYGELGNGRTSPYSITATRVDFPAGVRVTSLANPMPFDAGLAVDSAGRAWGWGLDGSGDLCLSKVAYTRPQQLPLAGVTLATGARTHSLLDSDGRVYACGSGDAGELGDGSNASSSVPVPVTGLPAGEAVTTLTSSWEGSGALLADGSYYDWGYNAAGQLGDGRTTDSSVPVEVKLPGPVTKVFQGGSGAKNGQTVAILENGSTWTWGDGDRGQLGTGSRADALTPVEVHVPKGVTFVAVSSGGYATYAIDRHGELWAWGDDSNDQLGMGGDQQATTVPVKVGIHLAQVSSTAQDVAGLVP